MGLSNLLLKFRYMDRARLVRKLVSFDDTCLTAVRPYRPEAALPGHTEAPFAVVKGAPHFWYADPSVFTNSDGKSWLFTEAFDCHQLIGRIACQCLDNPGEKPHIVLNESFHLSFPQVFFWDGEICMLPETSADRSIRIYRAASFPDRWELMLRLPTDAPCVDTVVTENKPGELTILTSEIHATTQYLYRYRRFTVTRGENGGTLTEDTDFLAKQTWSHRARNAGSVISIDGKRYLPTQESTSTAYGVNLRFLPLDTIDPISDFSAAEGDAVSPASLRAEGTNTRIFGVHSYARNDAYEVVDLLTMTFTPLKYPRRLLQKLRRS